MFLFTKFLPHCVLKDYSSPLVQWCYVTVAVWTIKKFFPLLIRPQGSQGCQKIKFFFSKMKLFSLCAKIAPKRYKLQKTIKIEEKMSKKPLFSQIFSNILQFWGNLSAPNLNWHVQWILAHLLTPLGPLGARQQRRYMSFKICFDYFVTVAPSGGFFTFMKMFPNVSFIIKVIKNSCFVSTNSHNFIVSRESHRLKA